LDQPVHDRVGVPELLHEEGDLGATPHSLDPLETLALAPSAPEDLVTCEQTRQLAHDPEDAARARGRLLPRFGAHPYEPSLLQPANHRSPGTACPLAPLTGDAPRPASLVQQAEKFLLQSAERLPIGRPHQLEPLAGV